MKIQVGAFAAVLVGVLAILAGGCGQPVATGSQQPAAKVSELGAIKTFTGGGEGGWDYVTIDSPARRVYVAHATRVTVFDADRGTVIGEVADTPGVHGVAVVPDRNLGFATNGKDGSISVFDLRTFKTVRKIKAGPKPDAILYDPASRKVFAFDNKSGEVTIVNPADLSKPPVTLAVGGKLEFGVADGAGHVYVNVEDKSEVVAIDSRQGKVIAHWPLAGGEEPTGLAIDIAHRRLFSGCANQKMVVLDADSGKVLATLPIGLGVDGVAFDPRTGAAMSANGKDGTITAVREGPAGQFAVIQTVKTAKSARTIALDSKTGLTYLPFAMPVETGKPKMLSVLVVGAVK